MSFPTLTIDQLKTACEEWQKRLRLCDWDIDIKIHRYSDIEHQGRCIVTRELKYAEISVRDAVDSKPDCKASEDMESVLLHEILHIPYDAVILDEPQDSPKTVALEQAFCGIVPYLMRTGRVIPIEAH